MVIVLHSDIENNLNGGAADKEAIKGVYKGGRRSCVVDEVIVVPQKIIMADSIVPLGHIGLL